ncbi:FIG028593: membrane protein [Lactobacillus delbrueckii subsp. lactis]|nr:FIG028593: membrane protein [Lactobacillus delbrueckii subsp. lactis]
MAQQYYSMDQIAKLAQISQQQVYYLINMKFKFKPTLTDSSGNKFYDERAVGQIFQELGKVLPKSAASPATDNGLLDINALAETTGLGKKKLRIFLREHKDLKPDFVDKKNHNKKYWGPSAIQYINDHFGAEEAKAEEKTTQAEEKTTEVEGKAEAAEVVEAAKTEEKQEQASQVEDENKEETTAEEEVKEEVVEEEKSAAEEVKEEDKPAGPRFIKKAPRPATEKLAEHPQVELPFAFDDSEEAENKAEEADKPGRGSEVKEEAKPAEKAEKSHEPANDQQFVVRKRTNDDKRGRGNYGKRRNNQRNGYQNQNRTRTNNYSKRRELFAGKMKLVTEKGTFYTDQFASLEELAEYVFSSKDGFMKVEKYNRGEFSPAYISTKIIIEFEEV